MKTPKTKQEFRVKFMTRDGSLVMNREADKSFFFHNINGYIWTDEKFIQYSLERDAREKGVRIVTQDVSANGINCIVAWL